MAMIQGQDSEKPPFVLALGFRPEATEEIAKQIIPTQINNDKTTKLIQTHSTHIN